MFLVFGMTGKSRSKLPVENFSDHKKKLSFEEDKMGFDLSWVLVVLSLAGNIFVVKKNVLGQWLWAISNVGWVAFNLSIQVYSQAFLFAVYLFICVWGIYSWTKSDRMKREKAT